MINCFHNLICPVCHHPLQQIERTLKCRQNHAFDIAGEGYVNLLLSRKKQAATVGDSKEMLQARRQFLERNHYAPLSQAINQRVAHFLNNHSGTQPALVLDAGCGEGYYLDQLWGYLQQTSPQTIPCLMGMDVSKTAVRLAARRVKNGRFFVSSTYDRIPLPDQSVHILLNIFAPRNAQEFARLIEPGGHLLIVVPQFEHLYSLRELIDLIQIEPDKRDKLTKRLADTFRLAEAISLQYSLQLNQQDVRHLLQMTPNARHLTASDWQKVEKIDHMTTEARFEMLQFIRR